MKTNTRLLVTAICMLLSVWANSQAFTNKGKEFWFGYGHHQDMEPACSGTGTAPNGMDMVLYISTDQEGATVKLTIEGSGIVPSVNWSRTYVIPPNTVISTETYPAVSFTGNAGLVGPMPKGLNGTYDSRLITDPPPAGTGGEGIFKKKAFHVESTVPVVAYAHIYSITNSGATMLMPTNTWGYSYTAVNNQQVNADRSYAWMYIVAKDNNTKVQILPSAPTRAGKAAGVPFDVVLQKGEIYQLIGQAACATGDGVQLTGTTVRSVAGADGQCHPVAVFAGSSRTGGEQALCGSSGRDNDMQQLFPEQAWGTRYLTAPFSKGGGSNMYPSSFQRSVYKVIVKDPGTIVTRNNVPLGPLQGTFGNKYYIFSSNTADYIEATKPVMVTQFMAGGGTTCNSGTGTDGDPEMIVLSPIEQASKKIAFFRNNKFSINTNWLTLIVPTGGLPSLRIDNSQNFSHTYAHPNKAGYTVVVKGWTAAQTQVTVTCDSGFNAITYGLGGAESYGFNAGTNIVNLNGISYIKNVHDTAQQKPSLFTCRKTPLKISALIAYQANKLEWKFSQLGGAVTPNADVVQVNPVHDSILIINGSTYYRYSLPGEYVFNQVGTFYLPIIATAPTIDICTRSEELSLEIVVKPTPTFDFTYTQSGCALDSVQFNGPALTTNVPPYTIRDWKWTYPVATGLAPDTIRNPKKKFLTQGPHDIKLQIITTDGCVNDTTRPISLVNIISTASIVATPATVCAGGSITYTDTSTTTGVSSWYWDLGVGTPVTVTTNTPQTATYPNPGTYLIKHVANTGSSSSCGSDTVFKTITVWAKPVAGFKYTEGCLPAGGLVQFTDTTTISDGQVLNWSWNFGDPASGAANTSTLQHPTHVFTPGTYTVTLTVTTANGCTHSSSRTIIFVAAPALTVTPVGPICEGSSTTLTASGGTTYNWSPSTGLSATTGSTVVASPTITTTYTVTSANGACNSTATVTVVVNPVPAKPTVTTPVNYCQDATASPLVATGAAGNVLTWYTNPQLTGGSTVTPTPSTATPGVTYYYVTQTTPQGCSSDTARITVTVFASISNNTISADQTLCSGTAPNSLTGSAPAGGDNNFTYQWQQSVDNGATWTDIAGATGVNYTPGTITGTIKYRRTVTSGLCNGTSNIVTITVQGSLTGASITGDQTICYGTAPSLLDGATPSGGSGTFTFQWEQSADNTAWTAIAGATSEDHQHGVLTTNTYFRRQIVSGICNGVSNSVLVSINPKPAGFLTDTTTCQNSAATITFTATAGTAPFVVSINVTTPGGSTSTITQNVATNGPVNIQVIAANAAGGDYIVALANVTDSKGCASGVIDSVIVTVYPNITNFNITASHQICEGQPANLLDGQTPLGGSGSFIYQWQSSPNGTAWTDIAGATSEDYAPGPITVSTWYRRLVLSNGCNATSNAVRVTVSPIPATPVVATASYTYCQGGTATQLTATANAGHVLTWYNNPALTGGSAIAPTPSTAVAGTFTYYVTQRNNGNCTSTPATITVTVNPTISGNTIGAAQTICSGTTPLALNSTATTTGGTGTYTYQWQSSADGVSWSDIPAATSETFNPGNITVTTHYRRNVISLPCTSTSNAVIVTVLPALSNTGITADETICAGATPALLNGGATAGGNGTYTYQWQAASSTAGPWTDIAGATSEDYQPAAITVTTHYRRQVGSGPCATVSNIITITVNPVPDATLSPSPANVCEGTAVRANFNATVGTGPFDIIITIAGPSGTTTVTETGIIAPSNIPLLPASTPAGVYNITLASITDSKGCTKTGGMSAFTVTVTAKPVLAFGPATPICSGQTATLTVNGANSYVWSPATGLNTTTGSTVLANPTVTTKYYVTGTTNGCTGTDSIELVVNPVPAMPTVSTPVNYCLNATATPLTATAATGNTLTWYVTTTGTGTATAPTPSTDNAGTFPYYVTQTNSFGCESEAAVINVVITEAISNNVIGSSQTLCPGATPAPLNAVGTPVGGTGTYTYQWQQSNDGGATFANIAGATSANYTPGAITANTQFRRVAMSGLCGANSNIVSITIQGAINDFEIAAAQTICNGSIPALLNGQTATGGNGNFAYQWESSADNISWTQIAGATNEDYQPAALSANTYYRRKVSSGPCSATSASILVTVNPKPSGTITGPAAICVYDAANISFTATGGMAPFNIVVSVTGPSGTTTVNQTVVDNGPASFNVIPVNSAAGNYSVALSSITDSKGCVQNAGLNSIAIIVNPKPVVSVTVGSAMCAGRSTTLTATGAATYSWTPATGLNTTSGASITANPSVSTTYTVTGSTDGCTDTKQVTVTVYPVPEKPAVAPVTYCAGATPAPLSATAAAGHTLTWYTDPALTGGTATAPTPATNTTGQQKFYVTQTSTDGCTSEAAELIVTVDPKPQASFTMPQVICRPASAVFTATSTITGNGALTHTWDFGDGATGTGSPIAHAYTGAGPFKVTLITSSPYGCADTTSDSLHANVFRDKPIARFNVNKDTLCQGQPHQFTDTSIAMGGVRSWLWIPGDGSAPQASKNINRVYANPGTYQVQLTIRDSAGCISDPYKDTVVVLPQPKIDAGPSFYVLQGSSIRFNPRVNDSAGISFRWTPPAGLSDSAYLRPTLTATQEQTYTLIATGAGNCTATDTLHVYILKPVNIPNAFSPNGDGMNDKWEIPHLAAYPGATVEVFNRYGQVVYRSSGYGRPWDGNYNGAPLPIGTYYFVITLKNGFQPQTGSVTILK